MKKGMLTGLLVGALCIPTFASPVDIQIGARGYGFGGAYAAIVNDPSAAYWNPAALTNVEDVSLMESNWIFQDISELNVNYLNFTMPVSRVGVISGSWLLYSAALVAGPPGEVVTNSAFLHTLSLSFGRMLWAELGFLKRTSLGFTVNRFAFATSDGKQSGLGVDLALYTQFPRGFSVGLVGRSLLSDIAGSALDPEARLGIGHSATLQEMHRITSSIDAAYKMNRDYRDPVTLLPANHNMKYFGGLEYALLYEEWELAIRGGGSGMLYSSLGNWGFSAGIGITYLGYSVQYAFKGDTDPEAGLGYSHRADLIFEFGNMKGTAKP